MVKFEISKRATEILIRLVRNRIYEMEYFIPSIEDEASIKWYEEEIEYHIKLLNAMEEAYHTG